MKIIESSSCRIPLITLMSDPFWLRQRDAISVRVIGHTQNTIFGPVYSTDFLQIPGVPLQPEIPEIDQIGQNLHIDWSQVGFNPYALQKNLSYEVLIRSQSKAFEPMPGCQVQNTSTCEIEVKDLMSEPLNLAFGDTVEVKVIARNAVGESPPAIGISKLGIHPFVSGRLDFGDQSIELDESRLYPSDEELSTMTNPEGQKLQKIKILTAPGYQGLQGIQFFFKNGSTTPFYRGAFSHSEEKIEDIEVSEEIGGIQMLMKGGCLEGMRLYGRGGVINKELIWHEKVEETGKWSEVQQIEKGYQIAGLQVNRPHLSIARVAFLLLESKNDKQ